MSEHSDSTLPENWDQYQNHQNATAAQVEKDFNLQGFDVKLTRSQRGYKAMIDELHEVLAKIEIVHHPRFMPVLYQLDLPEEQTGRILRESGATGIYNELAKLIVKRCLQKVCLRKQFQNP